MFWSVVVARDDDVTSSVIGNAPPGSFCPSVSSEAPESDVIFFVT
jgi:hypothetical protein